MYLSGKIGEQVGNVSSANKGFTPVRTVLSHDCLRL